MGAGSMFKQKIMLTGVAILWAICLAACGAAPAPSAAQPTEPDTSRSMPLPSPEITAPYVAYQSVLQGESEFYHVTSGEYLDIAHLKDALTTDDLPLTVKQYAAVDLDDDGIEEVMLQLSLAENDQAGFVILHYQDGSVYGYTLESRTFSDLKADGSFMFSSGAADWGFGTISFTSDGYEVDEVTYCDSGAFFVDREMAGEKQFLEAVEHQNAKESVTWYDYTSDKDILSELANQEESAQTELSHLYIHEYTEDDGAASSTIYGIDSKDVDGSIFNAQFEELIAGQLLDRSAWTII